MEEYKVIEEIYQAIETHGLMPTIKRLFGAGTRIQLPFSESSSVLSNSFNGPLISVRGVRISCAVLMKN